MELGFLLSIIGLLAGIWLYLYRIILDITVNAPADKTLLFLGYMHSTVLAYLLLALYVFFNKGRPETVNDRTLTRVRFATAIVLETWPVTMMALVVSFLLAKASSSYFWQGSYSWLLTVAALVFPLYRMLKSRRHGVKRELNPTHVAIFFGSIAVLGIPYMLFMSVFLADVQITTDKEFYTQNEPVLVSIRASGYIFRPTISKITFGAFEQTTYGDETLLVSPDQHLSDDIIFVDYRPQVFRFQRKADHSVKMAKLPQKTSTP